MTAWIYLGCMVVAPASFAAGFLLGRRDRLEISGSTEYSSRPMTEDEIAGFREAFDRMDGAFASLKDVFPSTGNRPSRR